MKKTFYIFCIFVCSHFPSRLMAANIDTISVHHLLQLISRQQKVHHPYFFKGVFPSYRTYHLNTPKADNNIFFTGLILFTLQKLYPKASPQDKILIDSIVLRAKPAFSLFKNKSGRNTYNFWQTNPPQVFPNGGWLNWMNQSMALPDDIDDTVISLLALNADSTDASLAHLLMQQYTNLKHNKKIHNTPKPLQLFDAYSTWFGNKMPIDFDICVLTNVLYFVYYYHLPLSKADSASIHLIKKCIEKKYIDNKASIISPHYQRTPVILYHLARLMSLPEFRALDQYQPELIQLANKWLKKSSTLFFDRIILSTALLQWKQPIFNNINIQTKQFQSIFMDEDFVFFKANMGSILPQPFKSLSIFFDIGEFNYDAPAYNMVLLLEYLLLQQHFNETQA